MSTAEALLWLVAMPATSLTVAAVITHYTSPKDHR